MTWPLHWLLKVEGSFHSSGTIMEIWSNSFRFLAAEPVSGEEADTWLDEVAIPALAPLYATNLISNTVRVEAVKFNAINASGHYASVGDTRVRFRGEFPNIDGQNSSAVEPQRAVALSWTTSVARGRASKGRIYLPGPAVQVNSSFEISPTSVTAWAQAGEAFIQATSVGSLFDLAIVSGVDSGNSRIVTGCRVGNRVDTIRRRRNHLKEAYTTG